MADVATETQPQRRRAHGRAFGPFHARSDHSISVRARRSRDIKSGDQGERVQPMRGFEDTYVDIVDYVIRITDRIWEDQDVGYIYDTYRAGCRVYDDGGPKYGVERVVEGTMQRIHAFPDSRHYADDVIWAGNEDEGFVTSHRAINVGHHLGPWRWGEPTASKISLLGDRQLRLRGERDLRGVGPLQRGRAPAPVRRRRPRGGTRAWQRQGRACPWASAS